MSFSYDIELYLPTALHGAGSQTESLGVCKIITRNVFVTVTEHNGDAHLVLLDEMTELDRTQPRYVTVIGKTVFPRRVDLPSKIFVETAAGQARAINGDQIARIVRQGGDSRGTGRISF
ncbi:MAG: hypothetical protein IPF53_02095 [Blastocatellia bacterium]|nr:hypothetical protein [Blastocatellia bacterium]MBK6428677.1 hypothetical protein [Blastocatellia bacterium]